MSKLYETILSLCENNGIKPGRMCNDVKISRGNITDLKMGRIETLSSDSLSKIASYFGVTVDHLLTGGQKRNAPALTKKDKRDAARDVERIMSDLENRSDLMFDGVPISQEARESLAAAMKLGLEAARLKNEKKYTPKKYRR